MDTIGTISMLKEAVDTAMDSDKMKEFEQKRKQIEERIEKVNELSVKAIEAMSHMLTKIDERIQDDNLSNEQLISFATAMMSLGSSIGMIRTGMSWGYDRGHV